MRKTKIPKWSASDMWECALGLGLAAELVGDRRYRTQALPGGGVRFDYDHGSGDWLRFWFTPAGCLLVGFDHESPMSPYATGKLWPGLYAGLPEALVPFVSSPDDEEELFPDESGRELLEATWVLWRGRRKWVCGEKLAVPDGHPAGEGAWLLGCFGLDPFNERHGMDKKVLARLFDGLPVTDEQLLRLAPGADVGAIRQRMQELGYGARPEWLPA